MDKMEINLGFCHKNAERKIIKQLFLMSLDELPNSCWAVLLSEMTFGTQMGSVSINDEIIQHASPGFLWALWN